jgi:hypothetical protein
MITGAPPVLYTNEFVSTMSTHSAIDHAASTIGGFAHPLIMSGAKN